MIFTRNKEKKKIYFVRHAATEHAEDLLHQPDHATLSKAGREQAKALGKYFQNIPTDVIISSSLIRAKETAEEIASTTGKKIIENELFRELRLPSELYSESSKSMESFRILLLLFTHADEPDWHYSDEENLSEIMARSKKALEHLKKRSERNIVVVSHSIFLRLLIAHMLEPDPSLESLQRIFSFFSLKNTGMIVCEEGGVLPGAKWKLLSWSDRPHLEG